MENIKSSINIIYDFEFTNSIFVNNSNFCNIINFQIYYRKKYIFI